MANSFRSGVAALRSHMISNPAFEVPARKAAQAPQLHVEAVEKLKMQKSRLYRSIIYDHVFARKLIFL